MVFLEKVFNHGRWDKLGGGANLKKLTILNNWKTSAEFLKTA